MTGQGKTYALPNDWELAERRLALLEACHDPSSIRRAELLGVGPGWHCLDAGAGGGSFSRWLAGRVGDEGRVVAADIDVTVLERLDTPGVEVAQVDLAAGELPGGFDFVHTRLVLLHVPAREAVLRRLAAALRPGGVLMVEEDDIFPLAATASEYRAAWIAFMGTMEQAGGQLFRGGSDTARFWSLTWLQVRERMLARGVPERVVDDGRAALEDPALWFYGPAKIIAWGRRC